MYRYLVPTLIALAVSLSACLDSSSTSDLTNVVNDSANNNTTAAAEAFPAGLAITSPTDVEPDASNASLARSAHLALDRSRFAAVVEDISTILGGSATVGSLFTPATFLQQATLADCYGPSFSYTNHPDGSPANGSFPSGDLGIWKETDSSGTACAAAQLNAQMQGISSRGMMALIGLASMVYAATSNSIDLPAAGASIDLASQMAALGVTDTSFTTATLAKDASDTTWRYELDMVYTDSASNTHNIVITLQHKPTSVTEYEGVLTYQVDDSFNGGHCPSQDVTYNGSIYYKMAGATSLTINARDGMYCGHGTSANKVTDTDVDTTETYTFIDPSETYNAGDGSGWANNFSILGAVFDPTSLDGHYTYAWQAGYGDSNSRILSVGLNGPTQDGEAYYGYGAPVGSTDGSITGFYCNWAGPGTPHPFQAYAQRQFVEFNDTSGLWEVPTGGSDIVYAPTNSCTYEGSPANFWYDRDVDGSENETDQDIFVYSSGAPDGYMNLDLMAAIDGDDADDTPTIEEKMASRGFVQPPM
ncbi:MAG TPA: hypothetical protein ENJ19_06035 [Gammaproteobacteria bacterium]|nr:hypothetical protein [Gammaproteobacteria bacterium]